MPSRRNALVAGGSVLVTPLAGCLDVFEDDPAVQEVRVDLRNWSDDPQTFHVTLETENEVLEWESHSVEESSEESVAIDPPEDAFPVGLHGVVDDSAARVEFMGTDTAEEDFCLNLAVQYRGPDSDGAMILQTADTDC